MTIDSVVLATALSELDPSWGTRISPIADGWAVLCGPGMFVNRLEGAGIDAPLGAGHLEQLETAAQLVGVAPAVDLPGFADATNRALLLERGYQPDSAVSVGVMSLANVANGDSMPTAGFILEKVSTGDLLRDWQRGAALGWDHRSELGRRASDAFARAAVGAAGSTLMLVREVATDRIVATCGLTIRDGLATLGGMSVLPTDRRRGVQAAAIELRLDEARQQGCDLAVTSTAIGGDSERNVARHGFEYAHRVTTWKKLSAEKSV